MTLCHNDKMSIQEKRKYKHEASSIWYSRKRKARDY